MRFSVAASVALIVAVMSILVSALPTYINNAGIKTIAKRPSPKSGAIPPIACYGAAEYTPVANKQGEAEWAAPEEGAETTATEAFKAKAEALKEIVNANPSALAEIQDRGDGYIGQSIVYNNCPFAVHNNIVHAPRPGVDAPPEEMYSILHPGAELSHPFAHDPRMGISWKLWRTDVENTAPVQFEWTWDNTFQRTWYDLSMINAGDAGWLNEDAHEGEAIVSDEDGLGAYVGKVGIRHAFKDEGMTLVPDRTEGNCVPLQCAPGEEYCTASYNAHNDWGQQHDCREGVDLKLTLCG
ncbi:uncharacterized protein A1O5_04261 [Cladophialophora psammophila CBS 110553]|uniref:Uncharacterized protein n=1 Tax=Cladophialophora psammophila CBS 110553 TaxID=1182543 RepID=W9WY12_9EURO|nr:uncharacterized protein A1O5_04261 [Cladophialophora psammophila CBS 110553]EXJ73112.1 hypothetical protein A1O5_04261 [Cladophialophora psammophila CBS 110553]